MKKTQLLMTILIVVALVGALALVKKNQDTRKGATFANTTLSVLPDEKIIKKVGDELTVHLWFNTESGTKVDGVQTVVCYGNELSLSETNGVVAGQTVNNLEAVVVKNISSSQSCATIAVRAGGVAANNLLSSAEAMILKFSAVKAGSGNITIDKDKSMVTGDNPASETDKMLAITNATGTTYEITGSTTCNTDDDCPDGQECYQPTMVNTTSATSCVEACPNSSQKNLLQNCTPPDSDGTSNDSLCNRVGRIESCGGNNYCCPSAGGNWTRDMTKCPSATATPIPTITPNPTTTPNPTPTTGLPPKVCRPIVTGDEPVLNFKVSYGNVKVSDGKCVVDWPMQVIVLAKGESKVYTGVKPILMGTSGDKIIYQGRLPLTGFTHLENVAAFIKGPKHLQMKYAVQNQNAPYDKAGGQLTLTKDPETSPVYNFSAYPIIPGDVKGPNSETPDGWIDGVDFAYVKGRSLTHETVAESGYLKADLDGNCQVNSNDVNVLKISLQTKQGQLY